MPNFKGLNKSSFELLKRQAAKEAAMAEELAARDAAAFENKALKEGLSDIDVASLPDQNKIQTEAERGFQLVGEPQSKDFTLGESGPISRVPAVIPEKNLPIVSKSGVPSVIDVEPINVSTLDEGKVISDIDKLGTWKKQLAGLGALGVGAAMYASGNGNDGTSKASAPAPVAAPTPTSAPAVAPPTPVTEEKDPVTEFYKAQMVQNAPTKPFELNLGEDNIHAAERIKAAQENARNAELVNQLGRSAELIGTSLGGTKPIAQDLFKGNIEEARGLVGQVKEQIQAEKDDPNSPRSKAYRQLMGKMNINIKGTASASDLEKIFPQVANLYSAEEARKSRRETAQFGLASRMSQQQDIALEKDRQKLGEVTNFNKQARGNAAQIANLVQQGDRLQTLVDQIPKTRSGVPDLSKVTPIQKEELIRTFDTLLAGKSTVSGQQELMKSANSIYNEAAKFRQYLSGNKAYGNEGGMLKSIVDTVNREKGLAVEKVKDMSFESAAGFKRLQEKDPAFVKEILKQKALMDDYDYELRKLGYRSYDINRLLNEGYDKVELLELAKKGTPSSKIQAKGVHQPSQPAKQSGKVVVKKGYNAKTNQTQLIYSDGSKEIVDGKR